MPYVRGGRRSELSTSEGRTRLARSVRLAMEDGGVTFVKLGQVLSTRRDLLPAEFISELSRLQDDAAEVPWPRIEQVLRSELGAEVSELFASFDREPIAAASIAQVHAATLPSGARVVVKVRRPDVSQIVDRDLDIAGRLAARLERSTSWGRAVGTAGLAAGFAAALREELDLRVEARNMTSVAAAPGSRGSGGIATPVPYQPLCTELVLVMERFDGRPLAAIDAGMPADVRAALARSLLDCLLREVMLEGTFHADPHPGNVLLLADGRLGLLDFGSVGRIDQGLRSALQRLLLALDRGDPAGLADALLEVVERPEELDELRLERMLGRFLARHVAAGITPDVTMFTDLFRIVSDHGLAVPPEIPRYSARWPRWRARLPSSPRASTSWPKPAGSQASSLPGSSGRTRCARPRPTSWSRCCPCCAASPGASTGSAGRSKPDGSASTSASSPMKAIAG